QISPGPPARHRRHEVPHDRHRQNRADDEVEGQPDLGEHRAPGYDCVHTHGSYLVVPASATIAFAGPGSCGRRAASQATTSEMSCGDMGWPGTLLRQSGAPSSGRPTITIVRSC